jgi:hypothetical protein
MPKLRRLSELPRIRKSNTETDEPKRENANTDIAEPN